MPQPVILSDIGNVLVAFDFTIAAQRCAEKSPFKAEQMLHRLDGIKLPYENGDMDDETFVREAIAALEFQGNAAEFRQIWCEIFTENLAMERTLDPAEYEALRAHLQKGLDAYQAHRREEANLQS